MAYRLTFFALFVLSALAVDAEWKLKQHTDNTYYALSSRVAVLGEDKRVKTYVSVFFGCVREDTVLGLLFDEDVFPSDIPTIAVLGRKVKGRSDQVGQPAHKHYPPIIQFEDEPRILLFLSDFRKEFLQYVQSIRQDRQHVISLILKSEKHGWTYTKNIGLANAKTSIRTAQKICQ